VPERRVSEIEVQPVVETPLFHDDPSRVGHGMSVGMPVALNYGVTKTIVVTVLFASAGLLVRYLSAVPSRGETLLGVGFVSAIVFYLWLLVKFAKGVYRWMKRHTAHTGSSSVSELRGR